MAAESDGVHAAVCLLGRKAAPSLAAGSGGRSRFHIGFFSDAFPLLLRHSLVCLGLARPMRTHDSPARPPVSGGAHAHVSTLPPNLGHPTARKGGGLSGGAGLAVFGWQKHRGQTMADCQTLMVLIGHQARLGSRASAKAECRSGTTVANMGLLCDERGGRFCTAEAGWAWLWPDGEPVEPQPAHDSAGQRHDADVNHCWSRRSHRAAQRPSGRAQGGCRAVSWPWRRACSVAGLLCVPSPSQLGRNVTQPSRRLLVAACGAAGRKRGRLAASGPEEWRMPRPLAANVSPSVCVSLSSLSLPLSHAQTAVILPSTSHDHHGALESAPEREGGRGNGPRRRFRESRDEHPCAPCARARARMCVYVRRGSTATRWVGGYCVCM